MLKDTKKWKIILIAIGIFCSVALVTGLAVYFTLTPDPVNSFRKDKPNIIILFADDTGYADFQTFGHPTQEWTGIDRMADEGMKFTNWYVPVAVCTPSRAALLTGRYPIRTGISGNNSVFVTSSKGGLPKREVTIAEALKEAGYATGMVGKWHLGINEVNSTDGAHLPNHHGFDFVGNNLPFTHHWTCDPDKYPISLMSNNCFLYNNNTLVEQPVNLGTLTSRLVADTKDFINKNKEQPFFFYLPFPQTHAAMFSDPRFAGSSRRGPYGDNVNEMGWAVDEVLDELIKNNIEKNTLVIFLSDNGPTVDGCGDGGTAGVFKGRKATTWEGGVRVPAVAWWPGTIPSKTISHQTLSSMDLLPTALSLAGLENYTADNNILIDGKVIDGILKGETDESPHEILYFYCSAVLTSVRYGPYKIHYYTFTEKTNWDGAVRCDYSNSTWLRASNNCEANKQEQNPPLIFDVVEDPGEQVLLNTSLPEYQIILKTVDDRIKNHQASIVPVASELDKRGSADVLRPCCNPPACLCNYNES